MAVMMKAHTRHVCMYGRKCCDFDGAIGKGIKKYRRSVKRSERNNWKNNKEKD